MTIEPGKFLITKEELVAKFGVCSALTPSPGTWVDPVDGQRHDDVNIGFYVDVELTPEVMEFLKEFKEKLKDRFKQREIYITTQKIKVL